MGDGILQPVKLHARCSRGPAALLVFALASCAPSSPVPSGSSAVDLSLAGGSLRIATPFLGPQPDISPDAALDPQLLFFPEARELMRCCLLRTLLSHRGVSTEQGGSTLLPDLAESFPEVSADGLTWTFHLRKGLHYAPPLQQTEIMPTDFIRALQRTAKSNPPPFFDVIVGFDDYVTGHSPGISGLEAPDQHTLTVHLSEPAGDLGERLALPYSSPIPPLPGSPRSVFGVATGHDSGDGPFLVSTGPYMIEGADRINFSQPPGQQRPASGFVPNRALTLVRNPSWQRSSDPLRPAYVDRMVLTAVDNPDDAAAAQDRGTLDLVLALDPDFRPPASQLADYAANPQRGRSELDAVDALRSATMNIAAPPFDDVHVRRAVNEVVDKAKILRIMGGGTQGAIAGHVVLDSLEDNALVNYDPFRSAANQGDINAARAEMALSAYDTTHSGQCSAAVCRHVHAVSSNLEVSSAVAADLARLGIVLDVQIFADRSAMYRAANDPTNHVAMVLVAGWVKTYPSAADFFVVFSRQAVGNESDLLLGATPQQLHSWGYAVGSVTSVDDRIDECTPLIGLAATRCWSALDEYITERVVPVVPLVSPYVVAVIPKRITKFAFDQAADLPALDQMAVQH